MITMIVCLRRKPGMTHEEFIHHWRDVHTPLALSQPDFMRHVRKYVQFHPANSDAEPGTVFAAAPDGFDVIGGMWFDNREAMTAALSEKSYIEILNPDGANMVDGERCMSFVAEEHVIYDTIAK